jgi:hypothetical protein
MAVSPDNGTLVDAQVNRASTCAIPEPRAEYKYERNLPLVSTFANLLLLLRRHSDGKPQASIPIEIFRAAWWSTQRSSFRARHRNDAGWLELQVQVETAATSDKFFLTFKRGQNTNSRTTNFCSIGEH